MAQVLRSLFVDDNVGGADNPTDAFLMYQKLKNVFHEAGLDLRKWRTNDVDLQRKINESEHRWSGEDVKIDMKDIAKILGVLWNVHEDTFLINLAQWIHGSRILRCK